MTFEQYMQKNFSSLWENQGEVTVNVGWLKGLWLAAQRAPSTGPSGIIRPLDMKFVPKRWGWELWIVNNEVYCGKKLFIKQGHWLSYHHHGIKDEVLFVESGRMWFTHDEGDHPVSIEMPAGNAYHVTPGIKHQMQAIEDTVLFEFSTQHFDEDSIRSTTDLVIDHEDYGK